MSVCSNSNPIKKCEKQRLCLSTFRFSPPSRRQVGHRRRHLSRLRPALRRRRASARYGRPLSFLLLCETKHPKPNPALPHSSPPTRRRRSSSVEVHSAAMRAAAGTPLPFLRGSPVSPFPPFLPAGVAALVAGRRRPFRRLCADPAPVVADPVPSCGSAWGIPAEAARPPPAGRSRWSGACATAGSRRSESSYNILPTNFDFVCKKYRVYMCTPTFYTGSAP